jgi:hypothetical protein
VVGLRVPIRAGRENKKGGRQVKVRRGKSVGFLRAFEFHNPFFSSAAWYFYGTGEQTEGLAFKLPLSLGPPFCSPKLHPKDDMIMADTHLPQYHRTQYERTEKIFEDGDIDKAIAEAQSNIA